MADKNKTSGAPWEDFAPSNNKTSSGPWDDYKPQFEPIEIGSADELVKQNFKPNALQSAIIGMGQGLYSNFGDELIGRLMAAKEIATTDKTISDWDSVVDKNVKDARDTFSLTKDKNPGSYFAGEVGGMIGQSAVPALNAAKGARVAQYSKAALQGGAAALGASDKDTLGERLPDAALGLIGGAGGKYIGDKVAGKLVDVGSKVVGKLQDRAQKRAVKAAGGMLKQYRSLMKQGRLNDTGQELLDRGLISVGDNTEKIAQKTASEVSKVGSALGEIQETLPDNILNPMAVAQRLDDEIVKPAMGTANEDTIGAVVREIERLRKRGDTPLSFKEARRITKAIDDVVEHTREQSPSLEKLKQARGIINEEIERGAEKGLTETGRAADLEKWLGLKKSFGLLKGAKDMANDKVLREEANRFLSPSDYGMLATGGLLGAVGSGDEDRVANALKIAALSGGANRLMRVFGPALQAKLYDRLAKSVPKDSLNKAGELVGNGLRRSVAPRLGEKALRGLIADK